MNYHALHSKTQAMLKRHGYHISADGESVVRPARPVAISEAVAHCHRLNNRAKQRAYIARKRARATS